MRGLFIKDLMLMKLQWRFFALVAALALIMGFSMDDSAFVLGYIAFVIPMFSLSTISYDEFDNGAAFLFTLPITRKLYVAEKYIFSLSLCAAATAMGIVFATVTDISNGFDAIKTLASAPVIFAAAAIFLSLMLPLQLKFGAEKARIGLISIGGILLLLGLGIMKLGEAMLLDLETLFLWLSELNITTASIIASALVALAIIISAKISINIVNKKEL